MKIWKIGLIIWLFFVSLIIYGWAVWHIVNGGQLIKEPYSSAIINLAKFPTNLRNVLTINNKDEFSTFIKNNYYKQTLTIVNKNYHPTGFLLISSKNAKTLLPEIKLFDLNTQKFVKIWKINFNINTNEISKVNFRFIHPLILRDSSIITNSSLKTYRINSQGNLIWESEAFTHHSLEIDENGNLFAPIYNKKTELIARNLIQKLEENDIAKIDIHTGKTIFRKSIGEILKENGYKTLIFSGNSEIDYLHVNDIQPAPNNSIFWKLGDLLISVRHKSTVFLYRPSTNKVIWLKTGPWLNQHDCDFIGDNKIGVFGNDVVRPLSYLVNGKNNQYIFNLETNNVSTSYNKMFKLAKIKTISEGRSEILENGDLFVEETNHGRIILGDKNGVNAIFVDRMDNDHIAMLGWSRYYSNEEMKAIFKK
jgi:outer membrane protein assembly factor BamB